MQWYYLENGQRHGPVDGRELLARADGHGVGAATMVWSPGLPDWAPFERIAAYLSRGENPAICVECGVLPEPGDRLQIAEHTVCAACKPIFAQRLFEYGVDAYAPVRYADIGARFLAMTLDYALLAIAGSLLYEFGMLLMQTLGGLEFLYFFGLTFSALLLAAAYHTAFVGRFGATPGKMALGLDIRTHDGRRPGYLLAFARFLIAYVSLSLFAIGHLLALLDPYRRTLHDRVCGTFVMKSE